MRYVSYVTFSAVDGTKYGNWYLSTKIGVYLSLPGCSCQTLNCTWAGYWINSSVSDHDGRINGLTCTDSFIGEVGHSVLVFVSFCFY